jgi:hypothetical protein
MIIGHVRFEVLLPVTSVMIPWVETPRIIASGYHDSEESIASTFRFQVNFAVILKQQTNVKF